jgi:heat-inducible transcriptional repressor
MSQQLPELTHRQENILTRIIHAYAENAEPISSKALEASMGISSATIRNEMARLEEIGYVTAPHTSAGRIPTVLGYRYFVQTLRDNAQISPNEQSLITQKFNTTPSAIDQWMKQAATLLARNTSVASLVTAPSSEQHRFKQINLIGVQGRVVLMVLVLQGGVVHQRFLNLMDTISIEKLNETTEHINRICHNLSAKQMLVKARGTNELEREVIEIAAGLVEQSGDTQIYQDGLSEVIRAFPDNEGAQQAVRVYEEPAFLDVIVREILDPNTNTGVQVIIAGDGRYEELSQLSIVLSRYGAKGRLSGTLGILGPTNINYPRAIGTVRHVAEVMTDKLDDLTSEDSPNDE